MTETDTDALLTLAAEMADAARAIVLGHYADWGAGGPGFDDKADTSPVTAADREAEAAMRRLIEARFPTHGIYGEEYGPERLDADFIWVLDPIDGTKSFITGKPLFGTLIGLLKDGAPHLGVMDAPALDERWVGAPGRPTTRNGQTMRTRPCPELARAWLYSTTPQMHLGLDFDRFERLRRACLHTMYGADCYGYATVAGGRADLVCEHSLQPYDYVALVPIVEGAGGRMTDWSGNTLGLAGDGSALASGDPAAHEKALALLRPA